MDWVSKNGHLYNSMSIISTVRMIGIVGSEAETFTVRILHTLAQPPDLTRPEHRHNWFIYYKIT
jgi:hypothetical protein